MAGQAGRGALIQINTRARRAGYHRRMRAKSIFAVPAGLSHADRQQRRHALVRLTDGSEQVCQIPARYPVTPQAEARFQLGRATEWQPLDDEGALYQGHGQKVWLNDNDEFPILSLDVVSFA